MNIIGLTHKHLKVTEISSLLFAFIIVLSLFFSLSKINIVHAGSETGQYSYTDYGCPYLEGPPHVTDAQMKDRNSGDLIFQSKRGLSGELPANSTTCHITVHTKGGTANGNCNLTTTTSIVTVGPGQPGQAWIFFKGETGNTGNRVCETDIGFPATAAPPSGSISASPNPCTLSGNACTSTISWNTANASNVTVKLSDGTVVTGGNSGSIPVPWISQTGYTFILYSNSTELSRVFVNGIPPANRSPIGSFEGISNASCAASGWAFDPDSPSSGIQLHVYRDGVAGVGTFVGAYNTDQFRPDVNGAFPQYGLTGNHGFYIPFTQASGLFTGTAHALYIYAIDTTAAPHPLIDNPPLYSNCPAPVPATPNVAAINPCYFANNTYYPVNQLSWQQVPTAAYYVINRADGPTSGVYAYAPNPVYYNDTAINNNTSYTYYVYAVNSAGTVSAPGTVTIASINCTPPQNLNFTPACSGQTPYNAVTFNAPANAGPYLYYYVYRNDGTPVYAGGYLAPGTAVSFNDVGMNNNTGMYYYALSYNQITGHFSHIDDNTVVYSPTKTTNNCTPPQNLNFTPGCSGQSPYNNVTFSSPANAGINLYYYVYRYDGTPVLNGAYAGPNTPMAFNDFVPNNNSSFYYYALSYNPTTGHLSHIDYALVYSPTKNTLNCTPPVITAINPITPGCGGSPVQPINTLSIKTQSNTPGISAMKVWRSDVGVFWGPGVPAGNGGGFGPVAGNTYPFGDASTSLKNNTGYTYLVSQYSAATTTDLGNGPGWSLWSNPMSVNSQNCTPPTITPIASCTGINPNTTLSVVIPANSSATYNNLITQRNPGTSGAGWQTIPLTGIVTYTPGTPNTLTDNNAQTAGAVYQYKSYIYSSTNSGVASQEMTPVSTTARSDCPPPVVTLKAKYTTNTNPSLPTQISVPVNSKVTLDWTTTNNANVCQTSINATPTFTEGSWPTSWGNIAPPAGSLVGNLVTGNTGTALTHTYIAGDDVVYSLRCGNANNAVTSASVTPVQVRVKTNQGFIQTQNGDVHTNQQLITPGGP